MWLVSRVRFSTTVACTIQLGLTDYFTGMDHIVSVEHAIFQHGGLIIFPVQSFREGEFYKLRGTNRRIMSNALLLTIVL